MARKDIDVRIRAKDDNASRNAKRVADALKLIGQDGKKASGSASKAGAAFSALASDVSKLEGRLDGLKTFGSIVGQMEKAGSSVGRLEDQLVRAGRGFAAIRAQSDELSASSANLKAQMEKERASFAARKAELDATTKALAANKALTLELARAQDALDGKRRKGIAAGGNLPSSGVGIESGTAITSARTSFATFLSADLSRVEATKNQLKSTVTSLNSAIGASEAALNEFGTELAQATATEKEFAKETTAAGNAVLALRADVEQARTKFAGLEGNAREVSAALGGLAISQEAVATASAKAEQELRQQARALAALEKFSTGGQDFADPTIAARLRKQSAAIDEARQDWAALEAEARRLSATWRGASGNVTQQVNAFNRAAAASKAAKDEYERQIATLAKLRGSATTTFAAWARAYNPIVGSVERATAAQAKFEGAAARGVRAANSLAPSAERAAGAKQRLAHSTDRASTALSGFGNNSRTTLSFMQRLRGEVIAATTAYIGFYAAFDRIVQAANAFRAVERAQQNLGVAFQGDTKKVAQEMAFLQKEADRLGYTFDTLANGYGKISVAAQSAGFTVGETRQLFTSIVEASRVSGASVDATNGVLRAFDQILSKGKIQAEELRGQLGDRMTGAFKLFADALGVTTAELDKMMERGEVFADRDTLIRVAERLSQVYGGQLPQALASVGFAMDSFARSGEKVNLLLAEGLVDSIKSASKSLADFLNTTEGQNAFRSIGDAAGALIAAIAEIPKYFDVIAAAAKALLALGIGRAMGGIAAGFLSFAGSLQSAIAAMAGFGPQLQNATRGQIAFTQAVAAANATMAASQRSMLALAARSRVLGLALYPLHGYFTLLRGAMLAVAGVARVMWTAVGGPIGLAVGAISLIYMNWETDAQRATTALQEHERQLGVVRDAYAEANGKAIDWAKTVNSVTLSQAIANVDELKASYAEATKNIEEYSRLATTSVAALGDAAPDDPGVIQATSLNVYAKQFREGTLSAQEFQSKLDEIALTTTDEFIKDIALEMLRMVNSSEEGTRSVLDLADGIAKGEAYIRVMNNTATEADKILLGLAEATADANEEFDNSKYIEQYGEAIEELKSKIPSLADEMERLKNVTELNASAWKAMVAAWNSGDLEKILEVASLWSRGMGAVAQEQMLSVFDGSNGTGGSAAALIKRFEGLPDDMRPYDDGRRDSNGNRIGPPVYRTGYGSDTKTNLDGSVERVTKDTVVTLADAERDLARRIAEFQNVIEGQIGSDRFGSFNEQQQAVLTSIAYNYGDLPDRILEAVRSGDASAIAQAIRGLGGDNGGINAGRRGTEAAIFEAGGDADINAMIEGERERIKLANEQSEASRKRLADLDHEIAQQALIVSGKEREAAIEDTLRAARAENPNITQEELATLREKTGLLYDQQNAQNGIELSEERVNQLYELRSQLLEQMKMAEEAGDQGGVADLKVQIEGVGVKLDEAIVKAIAMWTAIGGPEADVAIAKLRTMQMGLKSTQVQVGGFGLSMGTWYGIFQGAMQGIMGAFDTFAQSVANGENAFAAFGRAALQVLAQVLQQIAAAIIQMQILKLLQGFGGGIGGFATQMLGGMAGHTGGVVGSVAIGAGNRVGGGRPDWMRSALTYHTGGIAGLAPDEVSATLKKGEEIMTEEDPRHRSNLGGASSSGKGERLTQVLAIGEKQVTDMLNRYGKGAMLTHIKSEAPTIRRMLGV